MNTNSYRFFPAVSDPSTLEMGTSVWIIQEGLFGLSHDAPAQRFYVGAFLKSTDHFLLSENGPTLEKPIIIHAGPIWTRRAGVLEELLERARRRAALANTEVYRLEQEMAGCAN